MHGGALLSPLRCLLVRQFCVWQRWVWGGTCMGQVSAQASEVLIKLTKKPVKS